MRASPSQPPVTTDAERDPLEQLAEEFMERRRQGEDVSIDQFAARHPDLAGRIRDLFPAMLMIEDLKPGDSASGVEDLPVHVERMERLGDFRIVREIGRGGMGVVYEAVEESLGRRVALKVLPPAWVASGNRLQRFLREAQAAARLHHTNIVPVFGVGQQDDLRFYVMQYIPGQGLDRVLATLGRWSDGSGATPGGQGASTVGKGGSCDAISASRAVRKLLEGLSLPETAPPSGDPAEGGKLPEKLPSPFGRGAGGEGMLGRMARMSAFSLRALTLTLSRRERGPRDCSFDTVSKAASAAAAGPHYWRSVARIGIQAAEALQYAHRQGVLHRDIKPANLLLDDRGTVWIADFGLAKLTDVDDLTHSGDTLGTLRYMAPEQFAGQSDARSDVYSLGLTLYELLALRPAFDETDRRRLIRQVTQAEPPRPRKSRPEIPRDLETIVVKATASHPEHRYQTAGELAADLRCYLEDRPIRARRTTPVGRLWRWCRRNRALAALSGAAAALLIAVAVVASIGYLHTTWALDRAEIARQQAEEERARTKAQRERAENNLHLATRAFEDIFGMVASDPVARAAEEDDEDWPGPAAETVVSEKDAALLESMLKFYDQFAEQNRTDVKLQKETARAYRRVGDIQRHLGQYDKAETAYRRALAAYRGLAATPTDGTDCLTSTAAIHNDLGVLFHDMGRMPESRDFHEQAMDILRKEPPAAAALPESRFELARTLSFLSTPLMGPPSHRGGASGGRHGRSSPGERLREPRLREPAENNRKALEILAALTHDSPESPRYRLATAHSQRDRYLLAVLGGRQEEAGQAKEEAIRILKKLVDESPQNPAYRAELAETYAMVDFRSRDRETAAASVEQLRKAVEIGADLVARWPTVPAYKVTLAQSYARLAAAARASGGVSASGSADAEEASAKAVALQRDLAAEFPKVLTYRFVLARSLQQQAELATSAGQLAKARASLEEAIAQMENLQGLFPGEPGARVGWVDGHRRAALVDDPHQKSFSDEPGTGRSPVPRRMLARPYTELAKVLHGLGEDALADAAAAKASEAFPHSGHVHRGGAKTDGDAKERLKSSSERP